MQKRYIAIILTVFAFLLLVVNVQAQFNWVTANQATFEWDAVTQDVDGDPFPSGTHIEYRSWYINSIVDPSKANPILVEQTTLTQSLVTFPGKGRYWVASTAHVVDDSSGEVLNDSTFSWSDVPGDCLNGETFGFQLLGLVPSPGNMRIPTP